MCVSEHDLWPLAGTDQTGTNELGIIRALRAKGAKVAEHRFDDKDKAWKWIHKTLQNGRFIILATECWEHWVVALGSAGESGVVIFDSSNFKKNLYENGTHIWKKKKLMYMWRNNRVHIGEETENRIYAISVWK